jgi:hypothetical protein
MTLGAVLFSCNFWQNIKFEYRNTKLETSTNILISNVSNNVDFEFSLFFILNLFRV